MTRMTRPDCAVMCNLINIQTCIHTYTHTYIHTYIIHIRANPPFSSTEFSLRLVRSVDCWQQIWPPIAPRNPTAVCRDLGDSTLSSTRCSLSVCSDTCWQHIRPPTAPRNSTELLCAEIEATPPSHHKFQPKVYSDTCWQQVQPPRAPRNPT